MLAVFFGTDRKGCKDACDSFVKKQGANVTVNAIDERAYSEGFLTNAIGAGSLFGSTELYILDTPSNHTEFEAEVREHLLEMAESANTFIILEGALLAPAKKRFSKHTTVFEEYLAEKADRFNSFALADALAKKDKKTLWMLLHEARAAGLRDEELIGILWWQLKALRLAQTTKNAAEAGMKDFPYQKAKRSLTVFKEGEVEQISRTLLEVYHDGHSGKRDLDTALEKLTLTL